MPGQLVPGGVLLGYAEWDCQQVEIASADHRISAERQLQFVVAVAANQSRNLPNATDTGASFLYTK
jgi:hypothetical protein